MAGGEGGQAPSPPAVGQRRNRPRSFGDATNTPPTTSRPSPRSISHIEPNPVLASLLLSPANTDCLVVAVVVGVVLGVESPVVDVVEPVVVEPVEVEPVV